MQYFYKKNYFALISFLFFAFGQTVFAQQIRINEVVSSNSILLDEDGDSPDWFELHNTESEGVSLTGWTVTDDLNEPDKWTFPEMTLGADGYLQIWASDKDRTEVTSARTLVKQGDVFRYFIPTENVSSNWVNAAFDDSSWSEGISGFGYGDADDATVTATSINSIYLRKKFDISDVSTLEELILDIDYDDSFVAYLNGTEVARANILGASPQFNTLPINDREAQMYGGGLPERYVVENAENTLVSGENILCIQVNNDGPGSSDLTAIPFLSAVYNTATNEGILPPAILNLSGQSLHTNFKISSSGETLYLFDAVGELIDELVVPTDLGAYSWGLVSGSSDLRLFEELTPAAENPTIGFVGVSDASIQFSHQGGSVSALSLSLNTMETDAVIRYTLDATIPDLNSAVYVSPLNINQNRVVRARVFKENFIPSPTQNKTYLVDDFHDLPVISLVTEPDNFFDNDTGIYVYGDTYEENFPHFGANFWQDWERPVHLTFYEEDRSFGTAFDAGVKIFGNYSRGQDQRSLSIFARKAYGTDEINYPLFPELDYENFQSLVLRNAGNDLLRSNMRDATMTGLMQNSGLEYQAYRPTATYINGEYWGIYNLREKVNEHFLASKYNVDADALSILEFDGQVVQGDNQSYTDIITFVTNNSLVSDGAFQFVSDRIDVENYIIYQVAQIYFANTDWPGNNIKFWKSDGGKWRWILYDTDFGFSVWDNSGHLHNTLDFALEPNGSGWPNPAWSTLLFRKLVENTSFRNDFVNRFADEMNSRFLPENVVSHINTNAQRIVSEISDHFNRWGVQTDFWNNQINTMRTFGNQRPAQVKQHIKSVFSLPDFHELKIENEDPNEGYVLINNRLNIEENEWRGDYFENVPITIEAVAKPGHFFSHWEGDVNSTENSLEFDLKEATNLIPVFGALQYVESGIIINEINYNSNQNRNTEDWIELYNANDFSVNLTNWELRNADDNDAFTFPIGSSIQAGEYLIIAKSKAIFQLFYPEIDNIISGFNFDLSNENDAVRLLGPTGESHDEVYFSSLAPWSESANGKGNTLELLRPELDNFLVENWASVNEFGSPGEVNKKRLPTWRGNVLEAFNYFPNPFSEEVTITFALTRKSKMKAVLYDEKGAFIKTIFSGELEADWYEFGDNLSALSAGIYLLEVTEGNNEPLVFKWLKL